MNRDEILLNFRNLLYPNNQEVDKLNEAQAKKVIYEGLREFLKLKDFQFSVGSYYFDITPKNLSVVYETPDTRIEVSNKDVHFETTRQTPVRFFVISDKEKDKYPDGTPYIIVSGDVLQYDNMYNSATYNFSLYSGKEDIQKYLNILDGWELHVDELLNDPTQVAVSKEIKPTERRIDVGKFFNTDKIRPVEYDYVNNAYVPKEYLAEEDYTLFLPSLSNKKKIIGQIYSTIVEFYNEYANK